MYDSVMISPNYDVTKLSKPVTINIYIDIFEDRTRFWMIEPARIISRYKHGGFAVCTILGSYFEMYSVFFKGMDSNHHSKDFFTFGFHSVFPDIQEKKYSDEQIKQIIEIMYIDFRCGLFHTGLTKNKISLIDGIYPISFIMNSGNQIDEVQIDATKLISVIESHFTNYICELRNPKNKEIRKNFEKAFEFLYS